MTGIAIKTFQVLQDSGSLKATARLLILRMMRKFDLFIYYLSEKTL